MTINEKINDYIVKRGIKQSYIAQKTGITANKISSALNGKRKLSAIEFLTICEILEVDPKIFKTEKEE